MNSILGARARFIQKTILKENTEESSRFVSAFSYDKQVATATRVASFYAQRALELEERGEK